MKRSYIHRSMMRGILVLYLSLFYEFVLAQDVVQLGNVDFQMSSDSITSVDSVTQYDRHGVEIKSLQPFAKSTVDKIDVGMQIKPEVFLIPFDDIKTAYSGKADSDSIFLLKRAINLAQVQYKSEQEYTPISMRQTIDRVQFFVAQNVQNKLNDCGVDSDLQGDEVKHHNVIDVSQAADYIYNIELGVSRLVISKTLFSTSLSGEAEARITENKQHFKKIQVDSFGGGKVVLERFGTESGESDAELKAATSKVVDYLANKLGDKLCRYFN